MMDWTTIITALVAAVSGGGLWGVIQTKVSKRKTPYDMMCDMLNEQKKLYQQMRGELEGERRCSAEKSYVINQSRLCPARRQDPSIQCPVDTANDIRLKEKCLKICGISDKEIDNEFDKQEL